MTDLLRFLASEEAFALRREHAAPPGTPPPDPLRLAEALRRALPPEYARALAVQVELERRAWAKFADPTRLLFERTALEQATSPGIARFHAALAGEIEGEGADVVDLGCGLGADAMAFAAAGCRVVAIDRDGERARLAAHNLAASGAGDAAGAAAAAAAGTVPRALAVRGDAAALPARGDVLFTDPDRRAAPSRRAARGGGGRARAVRLAETSPSWETLAALAASFRTVLVKAPPAIPDAELPAGAAVDFLSEGGECREALLRLGEGAAPGLRRAVRVDADAAGRVAVAPAIREVTSGPPAPVAPPDSAAPFLLDPDPALRRAGGVDALARELGAARTAAGASYLFAEEAPSSPWFRAVRVLRVLPYRPRDLERLLAEEPPRELIVKQRGLALREEDVRRGLPAAPDGPRRVLVLWADGKRRVACLGEPADPR